MSSTTTYSSRPIVSGADAGALNFVDALLAWLQAYLNSLGMTSDNFDEVCPHCGGLLRLPTGVPVNDAQAYRYQDRKRLTPTQYLERLCRLSPHSRIYIYKLGIRRQILSWRKAARSHEQSSSFWVQSVNLCGAPLSPD